VLRLAEGGRIVLMMNRNRILRLTDRDCRDEKYYDEETEKNWSNGEHCYLHPSIQRKISDYGEWIVFGTAVDYRPRWGHVLAEGTSTFTSGMCSYCVPQNVFLYEKFFGFNLERENYVSSTFSWK